MPNIYRKKEETLIITNAKLRNQEELVHITVEKGIIKEIVRGGVPLGQTGAETIDAQGHLVSPPFVDPHVHLDAVLVAGKLPRSNDSGTLLEAIDIWSEWKKDLTKEIIKENALEVVKWYVANGVLRVRTHADCTEPTLVTVESLLEVKEEVKNLVDLQVVAFPQNGIFTDPKGVGLLEEALKMGADVVGGAPHIELTREDGVKEVEHVYDMAEKYDRLIDMHIDETGDPHSRFVEVMAKESIVRGFGSKATASHTTAMHNYNNDYAFKLVGNIAKSGINMITNPFDNSVLQNRTDGYPRKRGHTRVDELLNAGVNVSIGHDSIMDPWYSMGKGSMLAAANLLMHTAHMNGSRQVLQLFDMITHNSARLMAMDNYGIEVGKQADLVILDAKDEEEAIRLNSECLYVIRKGQVISTAKPAQREILWKGEKERVDFKVSQ